MLCRQMLCELGYPQLRFVLVSPTSVSVRSLVELFPFPALYRGVSGADVVAHAEAFGSTCQSITASPDWATAPAALQSALAQGQVKTLYSQTLNRAQQKDPKDAVHPLRYAAGHVHVCILCRLSLLPFHVFLIQASCSRVATLWLHWAIDWPSTAAHWMLAVNLRESWRSAQAVTHRYCWCKWIRLVCCTLLTRKPVRIFTNVGGMMWWYPFMMQRGLCHCGPSHSCAQVRQVLHERVCACKLNDIVYSACGAASPLLEGGYEARNIIGKL